MQDELTRSGLALAMLLGGLACGYGCRRTGLLSERWGRPLHLVNIIVFQANICWLTMWGVSWERGLIRLPAAGLALSLALTLVGLAVGRLHRFERRDRGTFALACGMSNLGSTGGMLVVLVLLGDEALQRALVFLLYWSLFAFLFCFPLARHFGSETRIGLRRIVMSSVRDVRMLPLLGMIVGLVLSAAGPVRPRVVEPIVYVLVMASGFAAMFAIGVTLHLRMIRRFVPAYLSQAAIKFLAGPAVAGVLVLVLGITDPVNIVVVFVLGSMSQAFYSVMIANLFHLNLHLANSMFLVNTLTFLLIVFPLLTLVVSV